MHPPSTQNQQQSERSGQHPGILPCLDIAENASYEAANAAKNPDGKEYNASQDKDIRHWRVGKMFHASPPGTGQVSKCETARCNP
jgi:hypothetical protein